MCRAEVLIVWGFGSADLRFSDLGLGYLEFGFSVFRVSILRV